MIRLTTFIFFIFLLFPACLFDSGSDTIVDNYEVNWIDVHESRRLSKVEGIVLPYVFAAGHDDRFVFAKQHPLLYNTSEKIDKSIVNFYIVERTNSTFQDKPVYGPLTKEMFDSLCKKLAIINPDFDHTYRTNF